jgi:hypothetical protein
MINTSKIDEFLDFDDDRRPGVKSISKKAYRTNKKKQKGMKNGQEHWSATVRASTRTYELTQLRVYHTPCSRQLDLIHLQLSDFINSNMMCSHSRKKLFSRTQNERIHYHKYI